MAGGSENLIVQSISRKDRSPPVSSETLRQAPYSSEMIKSELHGDMQELCAMHNSTDTLILRVV
jgi:hypothetical protein